MRRREFLALLGGAAATWPLAARAQQPNKIPRLCFLTFDSVISQSTRFDSFFEGLRELGYCAVGLVSGSMIFNCCLASLGGGNETALQSRRRTS
jgi:hypothetical protein